MHILSSAVQLIDSNTTIFWFRRDLRLNDNAGLYYALKQNKDVVPIFIFDTCILDTLEDERDRRVEFIHQAVSELKNKLEQMGSSLLVVYGNPIDFFNQIKPKAVYTNHDYEPYARSRDKKVQEILFSKGVDFKTYKDQVIFERDEIAKDNGEPYTVFTPYSKKWKAAVNDFYLKSYPSKKYFSNFKKGKPFPFPTLNQIGFEPAGLPFPERTIDQQLISNYHKHKDFPAANGTSRLGVHLRFGTLGIRNVVRLAQNESEVWLSELIWREFFQMILWHFPKVERAFKPAYDKIEWRNNENEFNAWCEGKTGYPIVDAGMRELNSTGLMHNRVRMIAASFLTKHLLIDWRWGEAYFAKKLLDFELASNNGGWQWAAGSGCDAAPYFRIFNPALQAEKFDPKQEYIMRWIPELNTREYPKPIVEHSHARARALTAYQKALRNP